MSARKQLHRISSSNIPGAKVKKEVLQGKHNVEFFICHSPGVGTAALCYVFLSIVLHLNLCVLLPAMHWKTPAQGRRNLSCFSFGGLEVDTRLITSLWINGLFICIKWLDIKNLNIFPLKYVRVFHMILRINVINLLVFKGSEKCRLRYGVWILGALAYSWKGLWYSSCLSVCSSFRMYQRQFQLSASRSVFQSVHPDILLFNINTSVKPR